MRPNNFAPTPPSAAWPTTVHGGMRCPDLVWCDPTLPAVLAAAPVEDIASAWWVGPMSQAREFAAALAQGAHELSELLTKHGDMAPVDGDPSSDPAPRCQGVGVWVHDASGQALVGAINMHPAWAGMVAALEQDNTGRGIATLPVLDKSRWAAWLLVADDTDDNTQERMSDGVPAMPAQAVTAAFAAS